VSYDLRSCWLAHCISFRLPVPPASIGRECDSTLDGRISRCTLTAHFISRIFFILFILSLRREITFIRFGRSLCVGTLVDCQRSNERGKTHRKRIGSMKTKKIQTKHEPLNHRCARSVSPTSLRTAPSSDAVFVQALRRGRCCRSRRRRRRHKPRNRWSPSISSLPQRLDRLHARGAETNGTTVYLAFRTRFAGRQLGRRRRRRPAVGRSSRAEGVETPRGRSVAAPAVP
jgi:hypothetical protein